MLVELIILSCTSFACLYPLCCWMHPGVAITTTFVRFTFILSLVMTMIATVLLFPGDDRMSRGLAIAWMCTLVPSMITTWNRDRIPEVLATLATVPGLLLFGRLLIAMHASSPEAWLVSLLGGASAVLVVYNTALGHWFLETKGRVPVAHLMTGVKILWAVLGLRLAWNLVQASRLTAYSGGEPVSLVRYMFGLEGFFLSVGILMGTLLPVVLMWFVYQTLKISSTTSATGVLYGTMLCILMGDLIYRYYLIAHGLAL